VAQQYRRVLHTERRVEWLGTTGKLYAVVVRLQQMERDFWGQGAYTADGEPTIAMVAVVDGVELRRGDYIRTLPAPVQGCVAQIGSIGRRPAILDQITAILDQITQCRQEVEQHPVWQAYQSVLARAETIGREYAAHTARVDRMMDAQGDCHATR
jgi:hypothetical protein